MNKDPNPSQNPDEIKVKFNQAHFLLSVGRLEQLPDDSGIEVAFIGRSNAGKSSALNILTNQNGLAKVSKTPGRTQLINVFRINDQIRLIDLPGYGYAKVPEKVKKDWMVLLDRYLRDRMCLQGLVIVMDIRHPLQDNDWEFLNWTEDCNIKTHILLTKADKLSFGQRKTTLLNTLRKVKSFRNEVTAQIFSAHNREGLEEFQAKLTEWYLPALTDPEDHTN